MTLWISVKDKLPTKLQKVLFHWLINGHNRNISMGYMCDAGWNIYIPYHSYSLRTGIFPVTHWAELPEFPKCEIKNRMNRENIIDDLVGDIPFEGTQPFIDIGFIDEPQRITDTEARDFAQRFCEENKDILKRLPDR